MLQKIILGIMLIAILIAPAQVFAYGGGFPPIVGPGPNIGERIEDIHERIQSRFANFRTAVSNVLGRIHLLFN